MSDLWPLLIAVGVPLALRLIDMFLPKGTHIRLPERWFEHDRPTEEDNDEQ